MHYWNSFILKVNFAVRTNLEQWDCNYSKNWEQTCLECLKAKKKEGEEGKEAVYRTCSAKELLWKIS